MFDSVLHLPAYSSIESLISSENSQTALRTLLTRHRQPHLFTLIMAHNKGTKRKAEQQLSKPSSANLTPAKAATTAPVRSNKRSQPPAPIVAPKAATQSEQQTAAPVSDTSDSDSSDSDSDSDAVPDIKSVSHVKQPSAASTCTSDAAATDFGAPPSLQTKRQPLVIIVLLKAGLETVKTKKGYELITADTHASLLSKLGKDPSQFRPDIVHQCLLTLLDSPLNKSGLLQVYIQTDKHQLISVNPSIRIPRTFKRFAGLMVQLLHKLKIRSADSKDVLMKMIQNPVTQHLPPGCIKLGTSVTGELVDFAKLAQQLGGTQPMGAACKTPIVLAVGSHASGPAVAEWAERQISVSAYPLSASVALGRLMNSFENAWSIL